MHYCGYIITDKIPTEDEIYDILEPYNEHYHDDLAFAWDWYEIGGRYGGKLKIKFNPENNEEGWFSFKKRNYKYFISNKLTELEKNLKYYDEIDNLLYMGLRENELIVDGAYYKDICNFDITNCFFVIDSNKNLYARELWENNHYIENKEFDNKVKKINLKDKFITVIDIHD